MSAMEMNIYRENRQVLLIAVYAGLALLVIKFIAFFLTNSNAILSDALESIINVSAGAFGIYALTFSHKPRDKDHPYGHGKIEFLSAGFEGGLIVLAGTGIMIKAVYNFIEPQDIQRLELGALLAGAAGLINFLLGFILEKKGSKNNSIVLIAGGKHLKSDAYSSAGLILGIIITIWTGQLWMDNLIAIIFGGIIIYTGYRVLQKAFAGIMDKQDYKLIDVLVSRLNELRKEDWIDVHNFRIIKYGSKLHIDCHITIPWYYSVQQAHDLVEDFEQTIIHLEKDTLELFIHTDPCKPTSCRICKKMDCHVRKSAFQAQIPWTLDNVMSNKKHIWEKEL